MQDQGTGRHLENQILTAGSGHLIAPAVLTVVRREMVSEAVILQGVQIAVSPQHDVTAAASVAAVGSAVGDVFFAPERNGAIAAFT